MKIRKQYLIIFLALSLVSSCIFFDNNQILTLNKETISARWNVDNSSIYESFEFNESGNCIIVYKNGTEPVENKIGYLNSYEIINDSIVNLSNFGNISISELTKSSIRFSTQSSNDPDSNKIIEGTPSDEFLRSTNTDLLCKTWKLIAVNGDSTIGTTLERTVIFSRAGTYFVTLLNDDNEGYLAYWKWYNNSSTQFLYDNYGEVDWDDAQPVEIIELKINSLIIVEDDTLVLIPVQTEDL